MEKNKYSEQDWTTVVLTKKPPQKDKKVDVSHVKKEEEEIPKTPTMNKAFRQRILAARLKKKLGQAAFAKMLSIDVKELSRWEKGEGKPTEKQYTKLNKFLNQCGI